MSSISIRFLRVGIVVAALLPATLPAAHAASTPLNAAQTHQLKILLSGQARGTYPAISATHFKDHKVARALIMWDRLRRDGFPATFYQYSDFLIANPGWPGETQLRRRAEALVDETTPNSARLRYFRALPPLGAAAQYRYAQALSAQRPSAPVRVKAARDAARAAWRSGGLSAALEAELLAEFGGIFNADDHFARADAMLWRKAGDSAARMLPFLTGGPRNIIAARIALQRAARIRGRGAAQARSAAQNALAALGLEAQRDPGLLADRVEYNRRTGSSMAARQLLARANVQPGSASDPNRWMKMVLRVAQGAANDRQAQLAFDISRKHGGLALDRPLTSYSARERDTFTSLEWLAGWTALHKLKQPADAIRHFENFAGAAKFSVTKARGLFWAARAAEAAGLQVNADRNYAAAARFSLTFYGQLAQEKLGRTGDLPAFAAPTVTQTEKDNFAKTPLAQAARMFGAVGDRMTQARFLQQLANNAKTSAQEYLVSDFAKRLGRTDYALVASRGELAEGTAAIANFAYPKLPLAEKFRHQQVMIHAITRQESRFDRRAVSHAGARGLMQLMPATARETARKVGVRYEFGRLTHDPGYNILLGSTYYSNLLDAWAGNHVLSVASYNAGPGNARKWIRANGDPRMPGVDVIKWIEEIPIRETRFYVKRVLANAVVYARLSPAGATPASARQLSAYLGGKRRIDPS